MEKNLRAKFIVLLGVLFVSFSSIFSRIATAPPLVIATYRLGFTSLMLLPFFIKNERENIKLFGKKRLLLCGLSGIFLALHFTTWLTSIKITTITSSTVLVNTHPIFIVLGTIFILKKKVSKKALFAILIALMGSIIITLGDSSTGHGSLSGDLLAIAGGFFVAGYFMIGNVARKDMSLTAYTFLVYSSCTLTLLVFDFVTRTNIYNYPLTDWLIFLFLALFCTILGHSVFNWALKYLNPTFVSTSILGEPVFASIVAVFAFKEIPSLWQIIGGAIILIGIFLHMKNEEQEETA